MSEAPLLQAFRGLRVVADPTAEQNEAGNASALTTVTLLDLGHDMLAALVQSVGVTAGLPALCAAAASHRLLAEACRRDDVWRGLLQHELGITTRQLHVVAPKKQMHSSGSPCIALMRALRRQPRQLLVAHTNRPPVVRGLTATFPVLPRGRDHCVRADVPLPLVDQHTCCRTRQDGVAEVRLSSVAAPSPPPPPSPSPELGAAELGGLLRGDHRSGLRARRRAQVRHWLSNPEPRPAPHSKPDPKPHSHHSDLCVAVGLCTARFPLDGRMPGWDYHSCGFHGDDGFRFHGSGGNGNTFAEARGFEPGSVVGCGVLFDSHKVFHHHTNNSGGSAVFYTVDAQLVGPLPLTPTPTLALALALTLTLALALTLTLTRWMVSSSALPSWCRISSAGDGLLRPCLLWPYLLRPYLLWPYLLWPYLPPAPPPWCSTPPAGCGVSLSP